MLKIKAPSLSTNCLPVYVFAAQTIPCDGKTSLPLCPGKPGRCSGSKTWEGRSLSRSSILTSLPLRESRSLAWIYNTLVSPGIIWWKTFQEGCQQPPRPLPLPLLRVVLGLVLVCPATRWNAWWSWIPGKITIILIVPIYLPILSFLGGFFFSGDRICHPAYCTTRTTLQKGPGRNKLLARAKNCTGQLKHPPAHRVPDHSFSPFGDPLPAIVII